MHCAALIPIWPFCFCQSNCICIAYRDTVPYCSAPCHWMVKNVFLQALALSR